MKKTIILFMTLSVLTSFTACGDNEASENSSATEAATELTTEAPTETLPEADAENDANTGEAGGAALPEGVTFAQHLFTEFETIVSENPDMTTDEIAEKLSTNESILFFSMFMPVEPGPISGFNTDITEFESASMFGPAMSSIPFVGYVFELSDESQADAFVATLKDNANPAWQVCVEAEETLCEAVGNKVFFVMAPLSNED